jgi:uncharacterized membrane protein
MSMIPSRSCRMLRVGGVRHPAVLAEASRRAASVQLRIADTITAFAGSMRFVYVHAAFQQVKADHDFVSTERELAENTTMTKQIAELAARIEHLTNEIHGEVVGKGK